MNIQTVTHRNSYFDFLKGIACISVVFIHCQFPGTFGIIIGALLKLAVPLFFMISGYYSVRTEKFNLERKVKHIIKIIVIAEGVIFIYEALKAFVVGNGLLNYVEACFNWNHLIQSILFNKPITYSHLWFLYALIYCYFSLFFIRKFRFEKLIPLFIIIGHIGFFVLGEGLILLGYSYHFTLALCNIQMDIVPYNFFLFRALPYFLLGYLLSRTKNRVRIPRHLYFVMLVGGSFLAMCERFAAGWLQFYIGTFIVVTALFVCAMNQEMRIPVTNRIFKTLAHIGNKDSDFIYVIHILVGSMMNTIVKITGVIRLDNGLYLWGYPVIVLIISVTMAEVRNTLISKRKINGK